MEPWGSDLPIGLIKAQKVFKRVVSRAYSMCSQLRWRPIHFRTLHSVTQAEFIVQFLYSVSSISSTTWQYHWWANQLHDNIKNSNLEFNFTWLGNFCSSLLQMIVGKYIIQLVTDQRAFLWIGAIDQHHISGFVLQNVLQHITLTLFF